MTTAQDVFDIAIRLMDAQNESTGATETADTKEYRLRAPSLLNSILDRAYPASDTWPEAITGAPRASPAPAGRVGRGGARERRELCPAGRSEWSGLCDDEEAANLPEGYGHDGRD